MFWIGNGNRTELHVKIVVQRTRMAQTEISSILYWYWHTIMQTHSGHRMTIQSSSTTYWHEELIRSHMSWIWLLGTEIGLNWMWGLLYNEHAWLKLKYRPSYNDIDIPSCRLIQVCSLWLEGDPSYHAHWWSVVTVSVSADATSTEFDSNLRKISASHSDLP